MTVLPSPVVLVDTDADAVLSRLVTAHDAATGATGTSNALAPGDPEWIVLATAAAEIARLRAVVNAAANAVLLPTARAEALDALAAFFGTERRVPAPAVASVRFFRAGLVGSLVNVPAGSVVNVSGVLLATSAPAAIEGAGSFVDVDVVATVPGTSANGYLSGLPAALVAPLAGIARAELVTATGGGRDAETDRELRARLRIAAATRSAAGPADLYRAAALSAHVDVGGVAVFSPRPGWVDVVVAGRGGAALLPGVLTAVRLAVSGDDVRPICDRVTVREATAVAVDLSLTWYLAGSANVDGDVVELAVLTAVQDFAQAAGLTLGGDVVPERLAAAVLASHPGVARAHVAVGPDGGPPLAAGSVFRVRPDEYAVVQTVAVYGGTDEG